MLININRGGVINTLVYLIWKRRWAWIKRRQGLFISPHCFAPGVRIAERGYIWVDGSSQIGENCTIESNVLMGKKRPTFQPPIIFIGDNCHICADTTILGPVRIGNDVTILQGSVVIKDLPDGCVAGGNPAKVIRFKTS